MATALVIPGETQLKTALRTEELRPVSSRKQQTLAPVWLWAVVILASALVTLTGLNALRSPGPFSPDSENFVDIARHVRAGDGVVQSTLGFNDVRVSPGDDIPHAVTSQAPGYPIAIAALSFLGIDAKTASIVVSVLALPLILVLVTLLALRLYGRDAAVLTLVALSVYGPLTVGATLPLSEAFAAVWVAACMLFLVLGYQSRTNRTWWLLGAGFAAGCAFATKYSFFPAAFVGLIFIVLTQPNSRRLIPSRRTAAYLLVYLLPFTAIASAVLIRNWLAAGNLFGNARLPAMYSLLSTAKASLISIFFPNIVLSAQLGGLGDLPVLPLPVMALLLVAAVFALFRNRRPREVLALLKASMHNYSRWLPFAWIALYSALLLWQATRTHFDRLSPRFWAPAGIFLLVLAAAVIASQLAPIYRTIVCTILLGFLTLAVVQQGLLLGPAGQDTASHTPPRVAWVADNTDADDLIIGNDAVDVPFYLPDRHAMSVSPYPYSERVTYEELMRILAVRESQYGRMFIVLQHLDGEDQLAVQYGTFVSALWEGNSAGYCVREVARTTELAAFELVCTST